MFFVHSLSYHWLLKYLSMRHLLLIQQNTGQIQAVPSGGDVEWSFFPVIIHVILRNERFEGKVQPSYRFELRLSNRWFLIHVLILLSDVSMIGILLMISLHLFFWLEYTHDKSCHVIAHIQLCLLLHLDVWIVLYISLLYYISEFDLRYRISLEHFKLLVKILSGNI